jgi:hypothetical protein
MQRYLFASIIAMLLLVCTWGAVTQTPPASGTHPDIRLFFQAIARDEAVANEALQLIAARWKNGYAGIIWDLARFFPPATRKVTEPLLGSPADPDNPFPAPPPVDQLQLEEPNAKVRGRLIGFLERQTQQRFGDDLERWLQWMWDLPYEPHPDYAFFKGVWYGEIDPRFSEFFPRGVASTIRLDEIDWGGVRVNGIPPLEHPAHSPASAARYLDDDHIVFGIALNGEARAYPKRILAWHEMALDMLGSVELTIVYCTLCGTVIPYESVVAGRHLRFGTSGLLYRSNKLMFDHETKSLWNTFEGVPVVGALVESGLTLHPRSVVTTRWGEWKRMHPETTVLSLETGHTRDYSEGAAYREYFGTDKLMFPVSNTDDRLTNKDEVLTMLLEDAAQPGARRPLAIAARFLRRNRVYHIEFSGRRLVIVTSAEGANRVYDTGDVRFIRHLDEGRVADETGRAWRITEDGLTPDSDASMRRPRVPAQRAFWFGWYAQFPDTELVK